MAVEVLNLVLSLLALIPIGFFLGYVNFKLNSSKFWKRRNVPYMEPTFIVGNTPEVNIKKSFGQVMDDVYFKNKDKPIVGMWLYIRPLLVLTDLNLIKQVMVKDFHHFQDRTAVYDPEVEPLSDHLFNIGGARWRNLRAKLTPTFTSGKMKMMFPTIAECAKDLQEFLKKPASQKETIEIKDILACFTTDVISSCAFGIQINCLKNPNAEFRQHGKKLFKPSLWDAMKLFIAFSYPNIIKYITIRTIPKNSGDFFMNAVKDTIAEREARNIKRNDFLDLLIQLLRKGKIDDVDHSTEVQKDGEAFSIELAAAQAFVFFVAGFETSSTTMLFTLYELAVHPDIRNKCQQEIDEVLAKHNNQLTYEAIQEMPYLDRIVSETLRKYPVVQTLERECTKTYKVPDSEVIIEKGMTLFIPISAIQNDPEIYENPQKYDPDRFLPEEKAKRDHFTHIPFGEGPRNCIGSRFGLMQTKVGLVSILAKYNVDVSSKTEIPVQMDPAAFTLAPLNGVHVQVSERASY